MHMQSHTHLHTAALGTHTSHLRLHCSREALPAPSIDSLSAPNVPSGISQGPFLPTQGHPDMVTDIGKETDRAVARPLAGAPQAGMPPPLGQGRASLDPGSRGLPVPSWTRPALGAGIPSHVVQQEIHPHTRPAEWRRGSRKGFPEEASGMVRGTPVRPNGQREQDSGRWAVPCAGLVPLLLPLFTQAP